MVMKKNRTAIRKKKHAKIRQQIKGTLTKPRLCIFRSNHHMYAQIIDDAQGKTLVSASTLDKNINSTEINLANCHSSSKVGELLAKRSLEKGFSQVVFDRAGYLYHGRVKALADSARIIGLQF